MRRRMKRTSRHIGEDFVRMSRVGILLAAIMMGVMLTTPAFAQFNPWPQPLPPAPAWGDYDQSHTFRDAAWWAENQPAGMRAHQPEWGRVHHPDWWGDFDENHVWRPAGWWWLNRPDWVRAHHPEWWGDNYE